MPDYDLTEQAMKLHRKALQRASPITVFYTDEGIRTRSHWITKYNSAAIVGVYDNTATPEMIEDDLRAFLAETRH